MTISGTKDLDDTYRGAGNAVLTEAAERLARADVANAVLDSPGLKVSPNITDDIDKKFQLLVQRYR